MKSCLIMVLFLFACSVHAQTLQPANTQAAIIELSGDLKNNEGQLSEKMKAMYPVSRIQNQYFIGVMGKTSTGFSKDVLERQGWFFSAMAGDIFSAQMPLNSLLNGFSHPSVSYLEIGQKIEPDLDQATLDIRADSVHNGINLPQAYTGKDVIIGVADWGFEYIHPTFYDSALTTLRVKAAWDQVKHGTPPQGFTIGHVYTTEAELVNAEADTFSLGSTYHGTHVAGIAGGSGGGSPYKGIAFESDLIFTQLGSYSNNLMDAYQWMKNTADAMGKRIVINNSLGSHRGHPLDGTSLLSQAIHAYSDSNVVFVISAGNNGGEDFHIKKIFANDSVRTRIGGFDYTNDTILWGQSVIMWGEPGNSFSARVRFLNTAGQVIGYTPYFNTATNVPFIDTFLVNGNDTVYYRVTTDAAHPQNNRPHMTIDVKLPTASHKALLAMRASSGTVHAYNIRRTNSGGGNWGNSFLSYTSGYVTGDDNYGVGHPGLTEAAITAAAHETSGDLASFSSQGPRIDNMMKPDLSAPGVNIASALNSHSTQAFAVVDTVNMNGNTFGFMRISGTSMSAPMITGVVALMLEASPALTAEEIKYILRNTTYFDAFTGNIAQPGHIFWGMGKVDAYAAVQMSFTASVAPVANREEWKIYPNPAADYLFIDGEIQRVDQITIHSLDGKVVYEEKPTDNELDISGIPAGVYLITLYEKKESSQFKLVIH